MAKRLYQAQRHGTLLWIRAAIGVEGGASITVRLLVDTGSSFTFVVEAASRNFLRQVASLSKVL